jgi:small subunit ribosomal protein S15
VSITPEAKQEIITKFKKHVSDTGSPEVQIAILTHRIINLTGHLKINAKDHSSRRGLLKMVGQRKRLIEYLKRKNFEGYKGLIQTLGLRK